MSRTSGIQTIVIPFEPHLTTPSDFDIRTPFHVPHTRPVNTTDHMVFVVTKVGFRVVIVLGKAVPSLEYSAALVRDQQPDAQLEIFGVLERYYKSVDDLYNVRSRRLAQQMLVEDFQDNLAPARVVLGDSLDYVEVWTRKYKKREDWVPYRNFADGASGVFICSENYQHKDENADDKRLRLSELPRQSCAVPGVQDGSSERSDALYTIGNVRSTGSGASKY